MMDSISNNRFRLSVSSLGAELSSFRCLQEGREHEYIWQKNEIWQGQSPLLFPIVGRLKDDAYRLGNQTYHLGKHGFARRMEFEKIQASADSIAFRLSSSPETLKVYPFHFVLEVCYTLGENGFQMEHRVKNTGGETLYFSIGAHPGFVCEMGDRIVMDETETALADQLNESALRLPRQVPVFSASREIEITPQVFLNDALIFSSLRSGGASLLRQNGRHVHVDFGGAPCLGLWAKPGAGYVCIEPWYGIDDAVDACGDFTQKEQIRSLSPGETFVFPVTVSVF